MITRMLTALLVFGMATSAAGCSSDRGASADSLGSSKPKPATFASASGAAASGDQRPWVNETGRAGKCTFVRWDGEGKTRKAIFDLRGPSSKEIDSIQTWEFYYDKTGKQLDSYPHSAVPGREPQPLGQVGDHIDKNTAVVECEITQIVFKDHSFWFNGNLVPLNHERPQGGYTDEDLKAHAGEKVEIEVIDPNKATVKLKNVSDKEVKHLEVDILYFKANGSHDYKTDYVDVDIKPGDTVTQDVKLSGEPLGQFSSVEGSVPVVRFADNTEWKNRNLEAFERP